MATTLLDEKISSFIEDKFPEFIKSDHPVFVEFLRLYYQFMEAAKVTLRDVQPYDTVLLENLLTDNFVLLEDGTKIVGEDSTYGAFLKGETVVGQTSGAVATILAEDNANDSLFIEHNRFFQVGEIVSGSTSKARGTISKYQGNPVQNIQQLLEYANVDKTLTDFLDQFRDAFLTAVPNTLAPGVSKRKLVKSVRDLYRAKGTQDGHKAFFRLMFGETPEIFYPTNNLLKVSAGEWTSNTVIRVVATANNPANLVGQTITQSVNEAIGATTATAIVEGTLQIQEGETTVFELILNLESIEGTFVQGASISGIDNSDADVAITGTIQAIISDAIVDNGGSFYTTGDLITVSSSLGREAAIEIVDVGSGEVDEIIIDSPGINYAIGQDLFFNNLNTEGSGATAKIINVGGAVAPEIGDFDRQVGGNTVQGEYRTDLTEVDHIVFEPATEIGDAYAGSQIQLETATFADLSVPDEATEVVHVLMNNKGSGYEVPPSVVSTTAKINFSPGAITGSSNELVAGETITNPGGASATIASKGTGFITITNVTGTFSVGEKITGSSSYAFVVITQYTAHGTGATFLPWSQNNIGSVKGVEVKKFGTGFTTAPTVSLPAKVLVTRNTKVGSPPDVTLATSFSVGDTITGKSSLATGVVTAWDNARQFLTVTMTSGTFALNEVINRGSTTDYAIVTKQSQAVVSAQIGTVGTTAGAYENDKGKVSESLMKIQDSFYYQDFSYVVRVGAAIADWRGQIKKAVHPAGFAVFGEVSLTNKVEAKLTIPVTGVSTYTPELASILEAVFNTHVRRKLGTATDGSTLRSRLDSQKAHKIGLTHDIEAITRSGSTATIETTGPHGYDVGDEIEVSGVSSTGYVGFYNIIAVTDDTINITVSGTPTTPAVFTAGIAKVSSSSPFDGATRDSTLSTHFDIPIQVEVLSGFASLRENRYGLGATKKTATRYMWSRDAVSDTSGVQSDLVYSYPGVTRRKVPETATDNVTAGGAGVYNSTMGYTTIQIGEHDMGHQMTLDQFGGVPINHIIRSGRVVDTNFDDDFDFIIMEDGSYHTWEEDTPINTHMIPTESNKLWNVPPPSYIRGVDISTGEYISFDDNTKPPSFDDNTAPPSFDATSGT